jgi:exosortase/archaeosortase
VSTFTESTRDRPADTVAGFLAAIAMTGGLIAVVERPVLIGLFSIFVGLLAAALADRNRRLAAVGVAIASAGWLVGMIVCVLTSRPLW